MFNSSDVRKHAESALTLVFREVLQGKFDRIENSNSSIRFWMEQEMARQMAISVANRDFTITEATQILNYIRAAFAETEDRDNCGQEVINNDMVKAAMGNVQEKPAEKEDEWM